MPTEIELDEKRIRRERRERNRVKRLAKELKENAKLEARISSDDEPLAIQLKKSATDLKALQVKKARSQLNVNFVGPVFDDDDVPLTFCRNSAMKKVPSLKSQTSYASIPKSSKLRASHSAAQLSQFPSPIRKGENITKSKNVEFSDRPPLNNTDKPNNSKSASITQPKSSSTLGTKHNSFDRSSKSTLDLSLSNGIASEPAKPKNSKVFWKRVFNCLKCVQNPVDKQKDLVASQPSYKSLDPKSYNLDDDSTLGRREATNESANNTSATNYLGSFGSEISPTGVDMIFGFDGIINKYSDPLPLTENYLPAVSSRNTNRPLPKILEPVIIRLGSHVFDDGVDERLLQYKGLIK